ncbi:hypothetical protein SKM51_05525 [Acinetobacter faecalis]|uniref:Uncharacterized protein n=1 Tax=Acinetobacter faecalis TaxID=2665161 RepID=A0AB35UW59_9GAMM|nr:MULTISPECIES: hypothetical protein [Acinetobacter]MDY6449793.1 hypothetical protein [Acinetobacter faecalis]MDY6486658.1 hypothetical protein [Acinetobacter faecalis]WFP97448.1 hypothetical protein P3S51_03685 [Acinetobacter sp. ANC 7201]
MKKYLILFLLSCYSFVLNAAEENIKVEETKETIFEAQEKEKKENLEKYDEEQRDYSFINNNFYEDDVVRVYNNTAYSFDGAQNKFMSGQTYDVGVDDFAVSFGYGMEFKLDLVNKVGYEYVSSFPYDRGQMVRFFWSKRF